MAGGNAIGTGAVVITANADGLASGLAAAQAGAFQWADATSAGLKAKLTPGPAWGSTIGKGIGTLFGGKGVLSGLQDLGGQVAGGIASLAASAKGMLTTAGAGIGMAFGGPIGAAVGGAVGGAVGDLGVVVAGALASPFEKIDEFSRVVKKAGVLGISGSQYQGLTQELKKVGIEGDMVDVVFAKLGNTLTKAANGDQGASALFQRLGLSAKELAGQPLDQTFLSIATAISKVQTPAEQANLAIAAFGKQGVNLLPTLQRGGPAIQEFIDNQKKLGAVLSDSQLKAAADASKAWKTAKNSISAAWDGLVNRATIIAAPIIEFAGKAVSKAFTLATPVFEWFGRAVETVADLSAAVFEQLGKWFTEGVDAVKSWGSELGVFTGKWPTVRDVIVGVFRAIGSTVALAWDTVKAGAGIITQVAGWMITQGGSIVSVFRTLVDLLKKLPDDVKPAWLDGFIEGVDKADDRFKRFGEDLKRVGKGWQSSFGQSVVDFNNWLDNVLKPKKIAPQVKPNAGNQMAANAPKVWTPAKLAGAVEVGSKEAYSITAKALYGSFAPEEDAVKQNGKKQDKTNNLLEQVLGRLSGLEGMVQDF